MITKKQYTSAVERTLEYFERAGILLTEEEKTRVEVADFGLSDLENIGLEILTYVNTDRVCAKELVLFPRQTCPEHRHIGSGGAEGKEETFRVRRGAVYLYVEGAETPVIKAKRPGTEVTVFHEIELHEGEQYTLAPDTKHWFQAGEEGAVVSEFSTRSTDETDVFTDGNIKRAAEISE